MLPRAVRQFLGLCRRAGAVVAGERAVRSAVGKRAARLVILAADAGHNATRRYSGLVHIPVYVVGTEQELGDALGLPPTAVVAVTLEGLAERMEGLLREAGLSPRLPAPPGVRQGRLL